MSTREQITVAHLHGHATYCVNHRTPVEQAVTELREITTSPELLAQTAGIIAGAADRGLGWSSRRAAARLLVAAGADRERLPHWIAVGRRNVVSPVGWGTRRVWPDDLDDVLAEITADV